VTRRFTGALDLLAQTEAQHQVVMAAQMRLDTCVREVAAALRKERMLVIAMQRLVSGLQADEDSTPPS
jgi:hypothetical protein